ncbi:PTS system mannose/fructose/sorbose family transporter subunit IID [Leclercia adecarboxylata]|jgi:fructoselysine and glucoselysine-specific PTS system IID component|uniref:PTS system mannose/fructose/sorbose family transporter subunit IID n=3 Tax=Enterobacteriaceae TaxID=543 RepID=UPI000CD15E01|nr:MULTISPECIES: PTS system mannose/fructose/sorbose family transporter subunit IID [Leclercia]NYU08200.1 PTS mannose transporter subunit IID [Enterobacteriaceae bacterium CCUG 67584]POV35241.1 PTS mannose transporter subunit IID [Leclercia sp. LSNIH5]POW67514.1 PTS mannose transporter subunit IID [Leclercia sp. LSNIH2]AUU84685.1 PTS mannose transporter subunit IID [Leclercia sp. LSNIH1]MCZ7837562.1 PTS system mannose/fructose/sorbose family transporter subunit IID [Leclercia adecarboxylata]
MTTKISEETLPETQDENAINARDLRRVFWRSFQMEFSWNYERQMNLAFVYALIPVLKKLYPQKAALAAALKRHLVFFNTTPHIVTLLLGITTAMEEKNSQQNEMDGTAIDNVKASLMGPLAGLGDSFFWGTLRLIATGIGTSLALQGNILGPILFLLVFNVPHILVRWLFTRWGYVLGTGVLHRVQKSGMMESLTYGASIIGLMVVGAMAASMINITIPVSFGAGEAKTEVQGIIDNIMPCLLPLISFGIVYWLLGRKVKPLTIIGGMALVGILGSWIGLF